MARNKHAATLFEVFQKGKQSPGQSASLSLPKWFSRSLVKTAPPVSRPAPTMKLASPVMRDDVPAPKMAPRPVAPAVKLQSPVGPSWFDLLMEWFEENKRTAIPSLCGAAAAIVLIALVVVFRHSTNDLSVPGMPGLKSTEELRRGPAHPEVLDVTASPRNATTDDSRSSSDNEVPAELPMATANPDAAVPATGALPPVERQKDLNYVLVQSYGDEKTANEARDFLIANNIACTVEHGLPGWRKDFYYVVGLDGFVRTSTPDLRAYKTCIETLSDKFAPKGGYKAFKPMPIKWK